MLYFLRYSNDCVVKILLLKCSNGFAELNCYICRDDRVIVLSKLSILLRWSNGCVVQLVLWLIWPKDWDVKMVTLLR